ncbi:MAG: DUF2330 domain-containing protein [Patescibacteria group bacterium]|nr:DUF2330 domain-containing protein [Patescibacteria group bacterium]
MVNKKFCASVAFAAVALALPIAGMADGGMIPPDWRTQDVYEPQQLALMVQNEGKEDLYLKVNYEGSARNFVWVIPTPALPNVSAAPNDLFEELSSLTTEPQWGRSDALGNAAPSTQTSGGIVVHEQKQLGVYNITVLSATKEDNVFVWLQQNGYVLSTEAKDLLDWYVGKEWYFTAVKVDPSALAAKLLADFQKIDPTVTNENFSERLAARYVQALRDNDFPAYQQAATLMQQLDPGMKVLDAGAFASEVAQTRSYRESMWTQMISTRMEDIQVRLNVLTTNAPLYQGYLQPLKLSFASDTLVYPLKISQMSVKPATAEAGKTAEVLIYVLAKHQVKAPKFLREYNQAVNPGKLESREQQLHATDLDSLQAIITQEYFLTKLRRVFGKSEMDEDLYFITVPADEPSAAATASGDDALVTLTTSYGQDPRYAQQIKQVRGMAIVDRLRGRIILRVEVHGEAYYINPVKKIRRYLGRATDAFAIMREEGIGITNANLKKIPVAVTEVSGADSDGDGLADPLEAAIGTNPLKADTDGDGLTDRDEVSSGSNPNGTGRLPVDPAFAKLHAGKIFLQVQAKGEAWYVNPVDGKRYFLGKPDDAYAIMRNLGLGISESDFSAL